MSLLDWAVRNVKAWNHSSVLTASGHGPDFCHPAKVADGVEFVTRQQWLSVKQDRKRDEAMKALSDTFAQLYDQDMSLARHVYDAIAAGKIPGVKLEEE